MDHFNLFILVPFCIVAETLSVLCFKRGVNEDEANPVDTSMITMILTKPLLWLGIFLWGAELIAWITVLETTPLSVAYPMMSLIYCAVPLAGKFILNEPLPPRLYVAAVLITLGVALVGSTEA